MHLKIDTPPVEHFSKISHGGVCILNVVAQLLDQIANDKLIGGCQLEEDRTKIKHVGNGRRQTFQDGGGGGY